MRNIVQHLNELFLPVLVCCEIIVFYVSETYSVTSMKCCEIRAFPLVSMKYRAKLAFLGPWIPSSNNREIAWYFDGLL